MVTYGNLYGYVFFNYFKRQVKFVTGILANLI
jgi:hypothetical protein